MAGVVSLTFLQSTTNQRLDEIFIWWMATRGAACRPHGRRSKSDHTFFFLPPLCSVHDNKSAWRRIWAGIFFGGYILLESCCPDGWTGLTFLSFALFQSITNTQKTPRPNKYHIYSKRAKKNICFFLIMCGGAYYYQCAVSLKKELRSIW